MPSRIDSLIAHIAQLERELETELNHARDEWRYRLVAGRIRFERDVRWPTRVSSSASRGSSERAVPSTC